MSDIFELAQQTVLADGSPYAHAVLRQSIQDALPQAGAEQRVRLRMLERLSHAIERMEDKTAVPQTGVADLMVLLRQAIRAYAHALKIPIAWWPRLQYRAAEFGIYPTEMSDSEVTLRATAWRPPWLADVAREDIEGLTYQRQQQPAIGDGVLLAFSDGRMRDYRSEAQKFAVDAVLHAPPGASILITLPTGGGKSLCLLLPAWMASRGGQVQGGTTLVVVPTVSLALDQQIHVQESFRQAADRTYRPYALTSDTDPETRNAIYQGIRDGTLPLLYTSPESLLNNPALHAAVYHAAAKGYLNWLVIDEAHMVEQWGGGFRTEFQLLAALRQQLLQHSGHRLRTLLLSATVSEQCQKTLNELFGDDSGLETILGNQLRPEISYWQATTHDAQRRHDWVLKALCHLPRPAILYVTRPEDAEEWVAFLHEQGYARVAAYTGKTQPTERARIMHWWTRDYLDLMVATSAFGLGVDKEDVRTVIHATLPETVDRFYQEVGRGGRDGCRSISLLCSVPEEDYKLARSMSIRSLITVETAWPRWLAMWQQRQPISCAGSEFLLDLEAAPHTNPGMPPTDTHRSWNEHVLLLLQRGGLLEILDVNLDLNAFLSEDNPAANRQDTEVEGLNQRRWLHIRLLETSLTYSQTDFARHFEPQRYGERTQLTASLNRMRELVITYSGHDPAKRATHCLGHIFDEIYPATALACGGCADCRRRGNAPHAAPIQVEQEGFYHPYGEQHTTLPHTIAILFTPQPHRHLYWLGSDYPRHSLRALLPLLLQGGFAQIILPADLAEQSKWLTALLGDLAKVRPLRPHRLLTNSLLFGGAVAPWSLYPVSTVVVYPTDSDQADAVYRKVSVVCRGRPLVQVIRQSLYLPSEHGKFLDRVNGLQMNLEQFIPQLERRFETLLGQ